MLRPYVPTPHVADIVDCHVGQPHVSEQLRHSPTARGLVAGGGGNRRQGCLTRECRFIRALDVRTRGANAIVSEEGVDHETKL